MKLKYIVLAILLFICMTPNANALCSKSDILRVKGEANKITVEIKRIKDTNGKYTGKYNIVFNNFTENLYIKEKNINNIYTYDLVENGTLIVKNIEGGNLEFSIYYETCDSKLMRTIKYNLPKYNSYSDDPLCNDISEDELKICGNWYQGELTEESFKKQIEEYHEKLNQQEIEKEKNNTILNEVFNYMLDYYIYIITIIILIVIIVTIKVISKKRGALE